MSDAEHFGRPSEIATTESIENVYDMVMKDHLAMRKIAAKWVPRLLKIGNL